MKNKVVYCEFKFLTDFLKSCPRHNDDPLGDDPVLSWRAVYQFLYYSETRLDISKAQFIQAAQNDETLLKFFKTSRMSFCEKDFPYKGELDKININDDLLHSVYFTTRNKIERAEIASSLGIIVLGKQDVNKFTELYKDKTVAIPKGETYSSWDDIDFPEQAKISNSMIIVDNYILDDTTQIATNIGSLLNRLLPETMKIEYHILIYGIFKGNNKSRTESDAKKRYEIINHEIRRRRPKLKYKLYILDTKEFHDRRIVTNNVLIVCGAGFDLFSKGKACKSTDLRFAFPYMLEGVQHKGWGNETLCYLIEDCLRIESKSHKINFDYWGEECRTNRLLHYYTIAQQ